MSESLPHKIFEGDTLRKRVLRKMLELSDGATVEERANGKSEITFRCAGHAYGWDTLFVIRYHQVTPLSILDMLRSFRADTSAVSAFLLSHYGVEPEGSPHAP